MGAKKGRSASVHFVVASGVALPEDGARLESSRHASTSGRQALQFRLRQPVNRALPLSSIQLPWLVGVGAAPSTAGGSSSVSPLRRFPRPPIAASSSTNLSADLSQPGGGDKQPKSGSSDVGAAAAAAAAAASVVVRHHVKHKLDPGATATHADGGVAVEVADGRRRVYKACGGVQADGRSWEGFDILEDRATHSSRLMDLVRSYLLPQGFPHSVGPQYAPYMAWRGVQYFFGGALSVLSTKALLGALGVTGRHAGEASAAINWVLKDGAGRLGRLLFARWGRELDCELKQFRLAGDLLMEAGAAMELCTSLAPAYFLPLACTANLAKNVAAVAASSTRAPIYKTFALSNNMADITAKGESVANLADIIGTVFGIALSKSRLGLVPTFCILSAGYLVASRQEVDAVELPYLNRARLAFSAKHFFATGAVPDVKYANRQEPLLPVGRHNQRRMVLGASVEQACAGPRDLAAGLARFRGQRFVVTYRADSRKAFILLHDGATSNDCLKAAFFAHLFLHLVDGRPLPQAPLAPAAGGGGGKGGSRKAAPQQQTVAAATTNDGFRWPWSPPAPTPPGSSAAPLPWEAAMTEALRAVDPLFSDFTSQAERQGWRLQQTMLNPREARLVSTATSPPPSS